MRHGLRRRGITLWFDQPPPKPGLVHKRDPLSGSTRFRALWLKTDGLCHLCGEPMLNLAHDPLAATEDHLIPKSKGGSNDRTNIKLAHRKCNHERGNMSLEKWFEKHPLPANCKLLDT